MYNNRELSSDNSAAVSFTVDLFDYNGDGNEDALLSVPSARTTKYFLISNVTKPQTVLKFNSSDTAEIKYDSYSMQVVVKYATSASGTDETHYLYLGNVNSEIKFVSSSQGYYVENAGAKTAYSKTEFNDAISQQDFKISRLTRIRHGMASVSSRGIDMPNAFEVSAEMQTSNMIANYIQSSRISKGCFYDLDKDGVPELLEQRRGAVTGEYQYIIHKYSNNQFRRTNNVFYTYAADGSSKMTLYNDNQTKADFYVADCTLDYNSGSTKYASDKLTVATYRYTFNNGSVTPTEIACYQYDNSVQFEDGQILITYASKQGNTLSINGFQNRSELSKLLGIDDYLSTSTKLGEVDLTPLWTDYNASNLSNVTQSMVSFFQ